MKEESGTEEESPIVDYCDIAENVSIKEESLAIQDEPLPREEPSATMTTAATEDTNTVNGGIEEKSRICFKIQPVKAVLLRHLSALCQLTENRTGKNYICPVCNRSLPIGSPLLATI